MNDRLADRTAAYVFQFPLWNATISRNYLIGAKEARGSDQEGVIGTLSQGRAKSRGTDGRDSVWVSGSVSFAGTRIGRRVETNLQTLKRIRPAYAIAARRVTL